jgi:hypothetical protein
VISRGRAPHGVLDPESIRVKTRDGFGCNYPVFGRPELLHLKCRRIYVDRNEKEEAMFKTFYFSAWILLIGLTIGAVLAGTFDAMGIIAVSLGVIGLVYLFALWAVMKEPARTA